jgi:hypothetical protein
MPRFPLVKGKKGSLPSDGHGRGSPRPGVGAAPTGRPPMVLREGIPSQVISVSLPVVV